MLTNTKITVFNKYFDATNRTDTYQRTVLNSAHWEGIHAISKRSNTFENADRVKISIPFSVQDDVTYKRPIEFAGLTDKTDCFTLAVGDKVAKGVISPDVNFNDLESNYDDVVNITSVDTANYGSEQMYHWELGCR